MCGILGIIPQAGKSLPTPIWQAALASLAHRGPDSNGAFEVANGVLGHHHLSIFHTWVRDHNLFKEYFHWQDGYAAFSVSPNRVPTIRGYIRKQEAHHRKQPFEVEWENFKKHQLVFPDEV